MCLIVQRFCVAGCCRRLHSSALARCFWWAWSVSPELTGGRVAGRISLGPRPLSLVDAHFRWLPLGAISVLLRRRDLLDIATHITDDAHEGRAHGRRYKQKQPGRIVLRWALRIAVVRARPLVYDVGCEM
jgi:hypothetical protein